MRCPDCGQANLPGAEDCEACSTPLAGEALAPAEKPLAEKLSKRIESLSPAKAPEVGPDSTLEKAVRLMRKGRIGHVLVVENGRLLGLLTEYEILVRLAGRIDPAKTRVGEVMIQDPPCLKVSDPVAYALHQMALGGYRHLPVRLKGGDLRVVTSRDLLSLLSA
jgi:CBS domain-containing protein